MCKALSGTTSGATFVWARSDVGSTNGTICHAVDAQRRTAALAWREACAWKRVWRCVAEYAYAHAYASHACGCVWLRVARARENTKEEGGDRILRGNAWASVPTFKGALWNYKSQ